MLLKVADIRQHAGHDCGEAAVRAVLAYHSVTAAVRIATETHGTDPVQIESALRKIGFGVTSGEMTVADLQHFCHQGRPVIALVHWPEWESSHFIVVRGVSRGFVHYQDVLTGPGKKSKAEFEAAWLAEGRICSFRRWGIAAWAK